MGVDVYKYKVIPISTLDIPENLQEISRDIYDISNINKYSSSFLNFIRNLERETNKKYILEKKMIGYNFPLHNEIENLNYSLSYNSSLTKSEIQEYYDDFTLNPHYFKDYSKQELHDEKKYYELLLSRPEKSVFTINYEMIVRDGVEDKTNINSLIKQLQDNGYIGKQLLSGVIYSDCVGQNCYIAFESLMKPVEYTGYFYKIDECGYQRNGYNSDMSFFEQFYGSCYLCENEKTNQISEENMISEVFDNTLLNKIKKTFEKNTPIQKWQLKKDEFVIFSV